MIDDEPRWFELTLNTLIILFFIAGVGLLATNTILRYIVARQPTAVEVQGD